MQAEFTPGTPIYMQISQGIRQRIASGEWQPGMRIPPVRELSVELGVNPNTAQRSLADLEREGLVYTERTAGRFITQDKSVIDRMQAEMAQRYAGEFVARMRAIGFTSERIVEFVRQTAAGEEAL